MITPKTLKGFRDFLPNEARKRQYVIGILKSVFELYGFEPLETPVLEYEEILTGKYGDEGDKLMYRFEDHGKRRVAMRYDQTVPLARVASQHQNEIVFPFKRYQISPVWRAENTQKGRYREFLQCDIDTVGTDSILSDAEIIATAAKSLEKLGFKEYRILINDRKVFKGIDLKAVLIIDKLKKIGEEGVKNQLNEAGFDHKLFDEVKNSTISDGLSSIIQLVKKSGIGEKNLVYSPTLARGLDYYTGMIFEIEIDGFATGSIGGGGRYNNLIGIFAGHEIPAIGFAFGFDRTIEAMDALNLFPEYLAESSSGLLVTIFSDELRNKSLEICNQLRANKINCEIFMCEIKEKNPLEKQLKYADQKKIPYALIVGPEEAEKNVYTLKNLKTREQTQYNADQLISFLRK